MRIALPEKMFTDAEQSRLSTLRLTLPNHTAQSAGSLPRLRSLFRASGGDMGRVLRVPNMPEIAQKQLGICDNRQPGAI